MFYISTRGSAPALAFDEVLLAGLACDGGLYVPSVWPQVSSVEQVELNNLNYPDLACRLMFPFVGESIAEDDFAEIVSASYSEFTNDQVVPLTKLDDGFWLLELFHGPTLAFKDIALQLLGRLFDYILTRRGQRITIVGATSGDTGSAAIEACKGRESVNIFILHPAGRVSDVQRRQMTTVSSENVHNIAINGTFDNCQDLVKACFNDAHFREQVSLSAVNSINWARIMAQIVYYFWAGLKLGAPDQGTTFVVPTGNFGNIFAGYGAHLMGLPINKLVVASNQNDILVRFFEKNEMSMEPVVPTVTPSMDIQVSSNFERLLFDLLERKSGDVSEAMHSFRKTGKLVVPNFAWKGAKKLFDANKVDDNTTLGTIAKIYSDKNVLIDPHTAIGVESALQMSSKLTRPIVSLATAHPAKFPDAAKKAVGQVPALPPSLNDLYERKEKFSKLPNQLDILQDFIRAKTY
mgnify:CR=1 FL=1